MLGVSSSKDGDNGIELSLELSIGGCYKEIEKPLMETESEKLSDVSDALDQQRKREFHALRRQEARRKKAEKQKRSISISKEKGYFEAQMFQTRVEDREKRENENTVEFARKNNVNGGFGNSSGVAFLCNNQSVGKQRDDDKNSKNLFQPISSKSLTPCQYGYGNTSGDLSQITFVGVDSECKNSGKCEPGNQKSVSKVSNGSLERSSSAFSDYQSNSQKGGSCSTDTGSHSNYSQGYQQQQLRASATSAIFEQAKQEINASSTHINSNQPKNKTSNVDIKLPTPAHELQPPNPPEQTSSSSKGSSEVAVVSTAKPPKPQTNNQMPFVSTTGNGPNGKKVNGFLYRYNKAEVCIVCVCHGSSFSPAEFVEHAGGVNISHPLKHITIVPAAFG